MTASPSSGSSACENTRPQKPVIIDGKFSDAHTPLMSMSRTRASMSQQPGRIWSKRNGSTFTVSGRRPGDRVLADLEVTLALELPDLVALLVSTMRGARSWSFAGRRPSNMSGGSTRWSSTEMTVYLTWRGSGSGRNSVGSSSIVVMTPSWRVVPARRPARSSGAGRVHGGAQRVAVPWKAAPASPPVGSETQPKTTCGTTP